MALADEVMQGIEEHIRYAESVRLNAPGHFRRHSYDDDEVIAIASAYASYRRCEMYNDDRAKIVAYYEQVVSFIGVKSLG